MNQIVIYVIYFDPIKIMTCWTLQNDTPNISFVKATNVVGKKMARNTWKMAISYLCHFRFETEFTTVQNLRSTFGHSGMPFILKLAHSSSRRFSDKLIFHLLPQFRRPSFNFIENMYNYINSSLIHAFISVLDAVGSSQIFFPTQNLARPF